MNNKKMLAAVFIGLLCLISPIPCGAQTVRKFPCCPPHAGPIPYTALVQM